MLAVAEMCVSFTTRTGSALRTTAGISTLHTASATTHWPAQRWMRPCSRQYTTSRCGRHDGSHRAHLRLARAPARPGSPSA